MEQGSDTSHGKTSNGTFSAVGQKGHEEESETRGKFRRFFRRCGIVDPSRRRNNDSFAGSEIAARIVLYHHPSRFSSNSRLLSSAVHRKRRAESDVSRGSVVAERFMLTTEIQKF